MPVDFATPESRILATHGLLKAVVHYCKLSDPFINPSTANIVVEVVYNCSSAANRMDDEAKAEPLKFDLEVGKVVPGVSEKVTEEPREGPTDATAMVFTNKYMT